MEAEALAIVEDLIGVSDLEEFRLTLLRSLMRVVPSDWASLNDLGPGPEDVAVVVIPEPPPEAFEHYVEHREENPITEYITRTRDGRATRFSDHVTKDELQALPLYELVYLPMRVNHQIAFTISSGTDRMLAIALSRADPDYTDHERDLLNRVRRMLISGFRAAIEHTSLKLSIAGAEDPASFIGPMRATGLTAREAEVMRLTALGGSNRLVATQLGVSDRTVGKHLERIFRKLSVSTRAEASARAWALARPAGAPPAAGASGPSMQTLPA